MIYRLRDAAKRRPTRSLFAGAAVLIMASVAHRTVSHWIYLAHLNSLGADLEQSRMSLATFSAESIRANEFNTAGLLFDAVGVLAGSTLLVWAIWRASNHSAP
jgi:hypothetical protein